jgi:hypothetical protein
MTVIEIRRYQKSSSLIFKYENCLKQKKKRKEKRKIDQFLDV